MKSFFGVGSVVALSGWVFVAGIAAAKPGPCVGGSFSPSGPLSGAGSLDVSPENLNSIPPANHADPAAASEAKRLPALQAGDLHASHLHSGQKFDMKRAASFAPKSLSSQPHFAWWLIMVNHHHCQHCGQWNYENYNWNCWRPCHLATVDSEHRTYSVGLSLVYMPDLQAYGVQSVTANSPAEAAGVKAGDLIVAINGQAIDAVNVLVNEVPRGRLELKLVRDGEVDEVTTVVTPRIVMTIAE